MGSVCAQILLTDSAKHSRTQRNVHPQLLQTLLPAQSISRCWEQSQTQSQPVCRARSQTQTRLNVQPKLLTKTSPSLGRGGRCSHSSIQGCRGDAAVLSTGHFLLFWSGLQLLPLHFLSGLASPEQGGMLAGTLPSLGSG